ncbi:A-kinase anchor protein 13 isoform 2 [Homo sapiens]|uniref:A-kinase anchor protein 13 n=2 Tax=Homo sapiens TaxID=9606 RepID=AKP13_HUMAN|nr:A-kinase anchor protein 13 isoform 2 [Homo sapiens]Q12802.2 RecName: Full=A-kinase anchor protein 13; Short=AKAP-13; AltName: Full=AKAP-Lbc; AltName: Full=Breast cancer nuclear receptor-binding auxiliary protein; AltName: Full=Guanine nucleotide exchange factor Lbc; AltName: Full=Human thyroid-anchoring protein 31; AltName: Full=Lymphoid blast crisis oncogene; Short=LBC oncogene; AltName: Full=Non-oncogenic Rho GTPase-specific GTP exchange factor; AltName: Full=Protein kinase A-anchoring protei|eukprot:NP_009131.2 A-kinase anchor protein 13 isoform 2 [Homo sapiens]
MKLNPQQAPLYGDCVVTVLLAEEDKAEDDVVFYLVFLGSTLRHCTSTRKVSSDTLETIAPGHDCCETVKVQLCASKEGLPVFVVAEEDFHFVQDEAYDAAQFLATSAGNQQALNFTRFLDQSGPPSGDVNSLDKKLVLAFRHLKLPTEWNVLGTDQSLHDAGPRETLMHFAVRLGLLRLTWFLLQKPGGRGALSIHNQEGATPVSLALERGYHKLHQLLTEENAGEPDSWSSLSYEIPYGDCSVRHHRELDIYTLTSESDSHHEHPFPGDGCTGPIFKLMNIQQQLMKTNLKQMDSLMPLMMTAQDPSSAPETDGQFLPCAPEPTDPQRLSSSEETESTQCCPGSPVAQTESPCDLSSIVEEENTDRSCRKKNKGVERKGEEVEPAPIVDSGTVSDQDSCLQSLPDCGVKGTEGLSSCGNRNEETGTKSSGMPTDQESLSSGDAVLQRDLVMEPGTAQYSSGGELGGISTTNVSTPDTAGEMEHGLMNPDATVWKNVLQGGESTKERFENSNIGTAGASDVHVTSKPVDKISVPNCAPAASSLDGNKPAESSLAFSNEETSTEKTAETETSRSREESADAPVDQNSVVIPAAAKDKISDGLEPYTLLAAGIGEAMSPSDLALLGLEEDVMPHQNSETNSSHAQSQKGKSSPICSTTGDDKLCADSACQQNTVTSSGDLVAKLCDNIVSESESTTARQPSSQDPPDASHCEDPQAHTVTSDPVRDTQERADFCPFKVVDNKGQRKDVKLDKPLTNMLEVVSHPHPVVPKMEKELVPDQAVISDSTFSLANSPGSESVTKDDALSFVPSQKEKGTATPELHTATDYRDGPDGNSNEPDTRPLEDRAVGLSTSSTAAELQHGMGNTSLTGLGGEHEGPAPPAIPEALNIKGNTDSSLQSVGKATLALDSVLTEEGKLLVVSESSAAQEQDKDKAVTCSSIKENALSSGTLQEEQRTPPPGQDTQQFHEKSISADCAKDKALQLSNSPGASSAFLKAETEHNKEVAPQVSLLTQGGAAQSLVPPGASLATESRQEALGAEHNSSALLPCLLPDGSDGSDALNCSQPSPLDVGVKNTQSQGKTSACEVSGDVTVDVTGVNALQGMAEPRRENISHNTQDILIPNVLLSQEKNAVLGLPVALQDKAVTDPQGVGTPEMIPLDWEKGKLEGADHSCTMGDAEEAQIDDEAHPVLLQPVAKELPTDMELSAHDDGAPAGVREVMRAPPSGRERSTPSLPCMVSAQDAPLPKGADLIEEAASRIVDAVIEQVKAAGALLTEGEACHMSLSSPELGPLTKGLESAFTEKVSTFPPGESLPMGSTPEEATGSLAGCFAGREEPEKIILPVQGPEPAAEMPDVKAEDEVDFRASSISEEVAVGSIAATLKMKQGPMTQAINRENWCTIEPCPDAASLLASKQSPECENFLDVGLGRECTSKQGVLKRESGSDSDLFHSPSDDMDSIIFPKPEEEHLACDITGSSSSTDDTASLDRHSSHGSDVSLSQILKPNRSRDRQSLDGFYSHGMGAEGRESESEPADPGDVEEEEMDSITEVPANCSVLRSSMRSLSPFRRHSWGPGKNAASDAEMNHRSSMRVLGDVVRRPPIHRRSFSLEGLTGGAGVGNKPSSSLEVSSANAEELRHPFSGEERVDSLVSLSEEDLESDQREHRMFDQQICHRSKQQGFNYCTSAISSPLTKSISLMTISHPGLDNSRPFHSTFHNTSANLTESITEENYNFLPHSPSKKDSEWKSGTKVSRTFSYIKNKMSSSKKSKEKEKEKDKIKEKEKDSKDKEKDKKTVNGHTFSSIPVVGPISCSQCMKPFTNKDAYTCANCSAFVHKGCRESLASCAKVKMKQPKGSLQAHDTSSLPTVIMRNKPSQPKERPRSAVLLVDETATTPIFANRRSQQSVSLSKSVSIQNITGVGNDENMSNTWKFLSHSTDSLNKISKVNESTESLTDEGVGTDMNEGQLLGDFEIESKQLEAESWSRIIDSKFLKQQKKDVVKRQEVIYELMQTEFHHVRTLKIMSGVYSQGMMADLLFEQQMVEKLFPCLDELISIHSQFFQRILERKKESLVDKSEKNFLIKRIGDVLVNQFSGENAERLKKTYGKFCGQHNQSVNYFKDLYAKDKRFQAFVKKKMSSSVVRRLGIPECILLVTQRITKYPVLFQRILQCTKDNEVEQEDLAQSLSLVKDVIGAVDSKVASYEKKVRLNEIYTKTDSKSIMRMKSGQMFAKEDLKRKKLVRDGSVFLKNAAGRLKEVQAVLLTDILVFLQEKDQKYIFASLDQKSTVISLKKLIVREVAHEEKGLFLISMGMTDPEMVEVHASSKEERNSWIQIIQDTINTLNRDEDEGIPSENEEEKKMLDTRARELKEQLHQKDQKILLLLEEKEMIFRDMAECSTPLPEDCSPTHSPRVLFRSNTEEALKGGPLMKSAINEVEILQGLVSGNLGGTLGPTVSSPIEQDVVGPVSLPRRAETFGGFDSHQMNASKGGEKEEGDDGQDLRRTESDSGLKKGGNANLVFMLKRNSEQVVQSVVHLYELLSALQGVVLQQDSYIEDQKLVLSERALTRSLSRPSSLIEQEKQRSLEKQRQDLANLQKQQAQYLEEKRRREREWEARERELREREALLAQREEEVQQGQQDLEKEREELQQKKGTYQYDLERLRAAQKQLEREQEQLRREAERLSQRQTERDLCQVSHPHTKLMRIPSFFPSPEEPPSPSAPSIAKSGSLDSELSVSPKRNSISRTHKDKGPFHILSSTSQTNKGPEGQSQAPASTSASTRLFGLTKPKEKKEKKKKNKTSRSQPGDGPASEVSAEGEEIFC